MPLKKNNNLKHNLSISSSQTRQLVTVCDSKLLSSAIVALAAARPELAPHSSPSPSSTSLSPSSRSPSRSPCRHPASPSRGATSPSRHPALADRGDGVKNKRASFQADVHEEEWVREDGSTGTSYRPWFNAGLGGFRVCGVYFVRAGEDLGKRG